MVVVVAGMARIQPERLQKIRQLTLRIAAVEVDATPPHEERGPIGRQPQRFVQVRQGASRLPANAPGMAARFQRLGVGGIALDSFRQCGDGSVVGAPWP